jgi:D-glycero-alpha-D-manno-heptose-7-phosphate kinase
MPGKKQLALEAIDVEQNMIRENVGSQDQVAAAYGGFNHVTFHESGEFSVRPVTLTPERFAELNGHLMLFYSGIKRTASDVAASYTSDLGARKRQLRILKDLVDESLSVLTHSYPIADFGALLHESWLAKRSLSSEVTNAEVEAIYSTAQDAGATGGKLLGAGGGGFILLFVPPDRQAEVFQALDGLVHVPFNFESSGSQVIFFEPEGNHDGIEARQAGRVRQPFHELSDVPRSSEPSPLRKLTVA